MSITTCYQYYNYRVRPSTKHPADHCCFTWVPSPDHAVPIKLLIQEEIFDCCCNSPSSPVLRNQRKIQNKGATTMEVPLGALLDITSEDNSSHLIALTRSLSDMGVPDQYHGAIIADTCHLVKTLLFDSADSATQPPPVVVKVKSVTLQVLEHDRDHRCECDAESFVPIAQF